MNSKYHPQWPKPFYSWWYRSLRPSTAILLVDDPEGFGVIRSIDNPLLSNSGGWFIIGITTIGIFVNEVYNIGGIFQKVT